MKIIICIVALLGFLAPKLLLAECLLTAGFESFNKSIFKGDPPAEKDPVAGLKYYTPEEVRDILKSPEKDKYVFIDTRPENLNKQCRIKDSVMHPFTFKGHAGAILTKATLDKYIADGKTVVFYCNSLRCHRSSNAAINAVCEWGLPANKIGWFGKGVPGLAKIYKRGVKGTNCSQFY